MLNLRLLGRRRLPLVRQGEIAECGLACLSMLSHWFGKPVSLNQCREQGMITPRGVSLVTLRHAAGELGFHSRALRVSLPELRQFSTPVILHWRLNHFVVLVSAGRRSLLIYDPAEGRRRISWQNADAAFSGVALELAPKFALTPSVPVPRLRLMDFARNLIGLGRGIAQLVALSLLLQIILLLSPLYAQVVVDDALQRGDGHLLAVLALGFALLVLLQVAVSVVRGWLVVVLGTQLASGAGVALHKRLLRLPYGWFERRATGDVLSRFRSFRPITDSLLQGSVLVLVDGLMAVLALLLMFSYSLELAAWVLTSTLVFIVLRILLYPSLRRAALAQVNAAARQESLFLESLRGIGTIKAFALESQRAQRWQRRYVHELNEGVGVARLQLSFANLEAGLFGLERVLVVYLGASSVLQGTLSVGMLFALLAYRSHFVERMSALVDGAINLRALDVHLERLADIALTATDVASVDTATGTAYGADQLAAGLDGDPGQVMMPITAQAPRRLELCDVSFRYGRYAERAFAPIRLCIEPGEMIVVFGPSGSGKTTLAKVAMGLLPASEGELRIGGVAATPAATGEFRGRSAAVLQDDKLFAGSILENVSLFAEQADEQRAQGLLQQLGVIVPSSALPMGLDTPIAELGGGLSGGQVQRLLLARALYRQPQYLFLDECTAHLDPEAAKRVQDLVRSLSMTRFVISHDPAFVARADRAFELTQQGLIAHAL
ncbi:MAG: peptidase domain-containing ABC transporter [Pseudomonadales bacterium]